MVCVFISMPFRKVRRVLGGPETVTAKIAVLLREIEVDGVTSKNGKSANPGHTPVPLRHVSFEKKAIAETHQWRLQLERFRSLQ